MESAVRCLKKGISCCKLPCSGRKTAFFPTFACLNQNACERRARRCCGAPSLRKAAFLHNPVNSAYFKSMRIILHSDMNGFYASAECARHPEWRELPVVVCGDRESRHGIVLAKNERAKACGIKTGDVLWEAEKKCANLIEATADFSYYLELSRAIRALYAEYTDRVESFGIDECWLDITESLSLFRRTFGSPPGRTHFRSAARLRTISAPASGRNSGSPRAWGWRTIKSLQSWRPTIGSRTQPPSFPRANTRASCGISPSATCSMWGARRRKSSRN